MTFSGKLQIKYFVSKFALQLFHHFCFTMISVSFIFINTPFVAYHKTAYSHKCYLLKKRFNSLYHVLVEANYCNSSAANLETQNNDI